MKYGDKTVLVSCQGLFVSLAERLARDFGRVLLHVPFAASFPTLNQIKVGSGIEGVEKVDSFFGRHFKDVDLFVFPDLHNGELAVYLEGEGKRVWGARRGEDIEHHRALCKRVMEQHGLPVQPWKVLTGMKQLRSHLKANDQQHVKIDVARGVTESFFSENYDTVAPKLDEIQHTLGCFAESMEFIVEDDLPDRVEVGIDTFCIDGANPSLTLAGIEVKDCGYLGQMVPWAQIPEPLRRWNEEMAEVFEGYGYRGFLSNEIRIGKDKVPYMIDATCRAPCPPSELEQELWTNLAEILWEGADGNLVEPVAAAKWGVEVILKSPFAEKNHQPVTFDPKYANQIKLFNSCEVDGVRYVLPLDDEMEEIGAVVGWGDTIEAAMAHAKEAGESIEGYKIKFGMGPAENANEEIAKLEKLGVSPFGEKAEKPAKKVVTRSGKRVSVKKRKKS